MSRNRATAKQRKQQQYQYGSRAKQGETAPEASKDFADSNMEQVPDIERDKRQKQSEAEQKKVRDTRG
jgi:hypothetical protein